MKVIVLLLMLSLPLTGCYYAASAVKRTSPVTWTITQRVWSTGTEPYSFSGTDMRVGVKSGSILGEVDQKLLLKALEKYLGQ